MKEKKSLEGRVIESIEKILFFDETMPVLAPTADNQP
jgi:hypothetical protein